MCSEVLSFSLMMSGFEGLKALWDRAHLRFLASGRHSHGAQCADNGASRIILNYLVPFELRVTITLFLQFVQ
jgi:hypothetical protein